MHPISNNLSKSILKRIITCFLSAVILLSFFSAKSQGNLLITPKRIVFEGSKRSEELNLANTGKDSATYNISFIQIRMLPDGSMENITSPDSAQFFADKYLRFFPRTVTLAPNEAQTVKIQTRRAEEMKDGEYRSHLYLRAVPNETPLGGAKKKDSSISVKLVPIFGISVPVIIRIGESTTQLSILNPSIKEKDNNWILSLTFKRTGNMSVYGDVIVEYISNEGKITRVGIANGLAVYAPNTIRHFNLTLNNLMGINYHSGKLHVIYSDQSPKAIKLAENYITLN